MPYIDDQTSALQTALKKPIPARTTVEIILDPDGDAIDLSSYLEFLSPVPVRRQRPINPYGEVGTPTVGEVKLRFRNRNNYFSQDNQSSPFYYAATRLYEATGAANTYLRVLKGAAADFAAGMKITGRNTAGTRTWTIDTIDTSNADYDQFNLTGTVGALPGYAAGKQINTEIIPGKTIQIKTLVDGETDKVTQFTGLLKAYPSLSGGIAEITVYDNFKELLEANLRANSFRILTDANSSYVETVEYNRAASSTGTIDLTVATINELSCPIGEWTIAFTDASGNFTVTDPEGATDTGSTGSLYSGDGISFPTTAWSGSFDEGDEISFRTTCVMGQPENAHDTIPKMVKALLEQDFGARLGASRLDGSIDDLITEFDEGVGAMTWTRPTTVLKALQVLNQHMGSSLFFTPAGEVAIGVFWPRYTGASGIHTLSPEADIQPLAAEDLGRIARIKAYYYYDHTERQYTRTIDVPSESEVGPLLEIKLPAYYGEAQARNAAERAWIMWRTGVRAYRITEKWNYGLAIEPGDIFKVSSFLPSLDERAVEVYEVEKDLNNARVSFKAFDINSVYSDFLFLDVDNLDSGKVVF